MKRVFIITTVCLLALGVYSVLISRHDAETLKPRTIEGAGPNWIFLPRNQHAIFRADNARQISNWLGTHQSDWRLATLDDFDPSKTQLLCDMCAIEVDSNRIVLTYDEDTNDPDDSSVYMKRSLSEEEQSFWRGIISQIDTDKSAPLPMPNPPSVAH